MLLIGYFLPYSQVGVYSAAWKIVEALAFMPAIVISAMAPVLAEYHKQSLALFNEKLGRAFRWLFWSLLAAIILTLLGAEPFLTKVFGIEFAAALPALEVLVWLILPLLFNLFVTQVAIHRRNLKFLAKTSAVGLGSGLLLGLLLIPQWGITGAALSTLRHIYLLILFSGGLDRWIESF